MSPKLSSVFTALCLFACSSAPATSSNVEPQPAPTPEAPPSQPPEDEPQQIADAPECEPILIRRAGLDEDVEACAEGIARFEQLAAADITCAEDADCQIYEAAGGCLGVNASAAAHGRLQPLAPSCSASGSTCWSADFTDHRTRCADGCCVIFEQ